MELDSKKLIEIIEDAGYETRSYSGRCMYGKNCVGVTLDCGQSAFGLAADMAKAALEIPASGDAEKDLEEGFELVSQLTGLDVSSDSMGLGSIIYFEDFEWTQDEDEDDNEGEAREYQDEADLS